MKQARITNRLNMEEGKGRAKGRAKINTSKQGLK
jgi:hypothetical protein